MPTVKKNVTASASLSATKRSKKISPLARSSHWPGAPQVLNRIGKRLEFLQLSRTALLLSLIAVVVFSIVRVIVASAPNPGHTWSEVGDVAVTVAQGGTGVATISSGDLMVGAGTSPVTSTSTVSVVKGGTGGTTYTANSVVIGGGTSPLTASSTLSVVAGGTGAGTFTANSIMLGGGTSPMTASSTLSVVKGGTGAGTFTANGVLYGGGTSPFGVTSAGTDGQLLLGVTSGAPAFGTMSGDITITNSGVTAIGNNKVTGAMLAIGSDAQGDIMYYNGTDYVRLAPGTAGQVLQTGGASANPSWVYPSTTILSGDVTAATAGTYTTIFTVNLVQNKINTIRFVLPQMTGGAGIAIQNRVQVSNNAVTGYCNYTTWTAATTSALDQIAVTTASASTGETAIIGASIIMPNTVDCSVVVDNTAGRTLTLAFTTETTATTVTTKAGAYYTLVASP